MNYPASNKTVIWMLIVVHLMAIVGCSTTTRVTLPGDVAPVEQNIKLNSVVLKDGKIVEFTDGSGMVVQKNVGGQSNRVIVGTTRGGRVEIDPLTVLEARYERTESSGGGSFLVGFLLGLPAGAAVFYLILLGAYSR